MARSRSCSTTVSLFHQDSNSPVYSTWTSRPIRASAVHGVTFPYPMQSSA